MPSSLLALAPAILNLAWDRSAELDRPIRILDVGIGNGKYGLLLREYLAERVARLTGIEAEGRYLDRFRWLPTIYDELGYGDITDAATYDPHYFDAFDLVLMLDVLEHIERPAADNLLRRIGPPVIISTPVFYFGNDTDGLADYPTEHHRSHWQAADIAAIRPLDREDLAAHSELAAVLVRCAPLHR